MKLNNLTCEEYDQLMSQLNPDGPPQAQLIHGKTPDTPTSIAILDASFNPMTLAHEALFQTATDQCQLDAVLLVLSSANVDKKLVGAHLGQRLAMLVHYAQNHSNLSVAICSHARFIDKIKALTPIFPPQTQFYFIVGYDTLIRLFDPKYYKDMQTDLKTLFATCHFVAANRGENDAQTLQTFLLHKNVAPYANRIHAISLPQSMANISSTEIRANMKLNKSIAHLVPDPILQAISHLHLYRSPK